MASVLEEMAENARLHAPSRAGRSGHSDNPKVDQLPNMKTRSPASTSRDPGDGGHNSDIDAVADEDMNLGDEMEGNEQAETSRTAQTNADNAHSGNANANGAQPNDATLKSTGDLEENPITVQARARLRARPKKRAQTPQDLESEEDDGMERNLMDYDESDGEDEIDSDVDMPKAHGRKSRSNPGSAKKQIKTVRDLPVYAQHAYVASTYGLPKFPMPMVVLPGLRSRKPPPIPIPDLTKRSRGRHVSSIEDDGRKYACNVAGCDKRFARGEHLKRHIRSIHTHEKPHQCPYPGCMRGFSRTDNMMQHMRTHDDWPDDEAAARMLAELPMMMPPMPWQMHSMFANWNPPRGPGMNLMMPMPLAEDPSNKGEGTSGNLAGLLPPTTNGEIPDAETNYAVEGEEPFGSPVDKSTDQALDKSPSSPPLSPARPTISPAMIMMPNATASTSNNPATPAKSTQATKTSKKSTAATAAANAKPGENSAQSSSENGKFLQTAPVMSASAPMPGWPMPPGMQGMQSMQGFPYMPMPPLPPGIPFPPPAIAVPIPTGAPLPHPSQLPPNAQLVPNPAGGHTLIIPPPPPHTWGMLPPGMTNMMPMPPLPATSNPNPSSNSNPDPNSNPPQAQAQANTNGNRSSVDSETSTPATAPAE